MTRQGAAVSRRVADMPAWPDPTAGVAGGGWRFEAGAGAGDKRGVADLFAAGGGDKWCPSPTFRNGGGSPCAGPGERSP